MNQNQNSKHTETREVVSNINNNGDENLTITVFNDIKDINLSKRDDGPLEIMLSSFSIIFEWIYLLEPYKAILTKKPFFISIYPNVKSKETEGKILMYIHALFPEYIKSAIFYYELICL